MDDEQFKSTVNSVGLGFSVNNFDAIINWHGDKEGRVQHIVAMNPTLDEKELKSRISSLRVLMKNQKMVDVLKKAIASKNKDIDSKTKETAKRILWEQFGISEAQ